MCGLLGLLTADADAGGRAAAAAHALSLADHRGPDETGTWHDADVVLGLNRLAVIDVERSHQPLHWGPPGEPDRYTVVFNGAIYNHPELRAELTARHGACFATEGDTEVIAAAHHYWGTDGLRRLRGMFAFLVWDARERVLVAARDAFGVKPLFVARGPAGIAFASEKKSLLDLFCVVGTDAAAAPLDAAALQHYLQLQYVPEPATMHRDIRRIPAGTHLTVRPGGEPVEQRWFTPTLHRHTASTEATRRRITEALRDSVAHHMRADVPVGAFLSGGIDSTAIVALAREHDPDLITFTAGFDQAGYSEIDVAAASAAALRVRHVTRTVSAQEVMDSLPLIVWHLDDPVADPALVPLWFIAREARKHVTVVLSGEGADELFGGYAIYREPHALAPFDRLPGPARDLLGHLSRLLPEGLRGKDLLRRGALTLEQRYHGNARIFRDDQLAAVLRHHDPHLSPMDVTAGPYRDSASWDPVSRMQHVDLLTWLRGDILVKADKTTMAHSVELRVPFLDPEVFAVASGLHLRDKLAHDTTKYALRRALAGIVPAHVLDRPKLGFPVPVRAWLREEMYGWARDVVRDSGADHLVDLGAARRMLEAHRTGPVDHSRRIWALLVFLIWHGVFVEERIRPAIPAVVRGVRAR